MSGRQGGQRRPTVEDARGERGGGGSDRPATQPGVSTKRAYEPPEPADGWRVLVDRIWPRGRTAESLELDERRPDLAPSTELRRWFGHDPDRWDEFRRRYLDELEAPDAQATLEGLARRAASERVTLIYSARDEAHNQARVLAEAIESRRRTIGPVERPEDGRRVDGGASGDPEVRGDRDAARRLVVAADRLVRAGVAITSTALAEPPAVELTLLQWRVLVLITERRGVRVGAIAAAVGQSVPSASRLLRRLEDRGLIRSAADPGDGRATLVRATPRGRRMVGDVVERRRRRIEAALETFGPARPDPGPAVELLDALARALERLDPPSLAPNGTTDPGLPRPVTAPRARRRLV